MEGENDVLSYFSFIAGSLALRPDDTTLRDWIRYIVEIRPLPRENGDDNDNRYVNNDHDDLDSPFRDSVFDGNFTIERFLKHRQRLETQRLEKQHLEKLQRLQGQPKSEPFPIVLVDMKTAAEKSIIHCVHKLLVWDEDLRFVALSYRWGELDETTVDTGLDYMATVTSFALNDFCDLCKMMYKEKDLRNMEYVWVDAICVDQNNDERRKATIHQMSNIYELANYIVAVPDLHLEHLKITSASNTVNIRNANTFGNYISQMIHGNNGPLPKLGSRVNYEDGTPMSKSDKLDCIEKSMKFLWDVIQDWTSRVWVISEYNIARKRQKMKYWFIQLGDQHQRQHQLQHPFEHYSFFEFEFNSSIADHFDIAANSPKKLLGLKKGSSLETTYKSFHKKMIRVLNQQTFLETILKSKASRMEDRFYAILPQSKYKHIIENKDVVEKWGVRNLTSVKLKLYEFMDTKDKLELLFLSGSHNSLYRGNVATFPTFATSTIDWLLVFKHNFKIPNPEQACNFDFSRNDTIELININHGEFKLKFTPRQYYMNFRQESEFAAEEFGRKGTLLKRLGFNRRTLFCTVCIPMHKNNKVKDEVYYYKHSKLGYIYLIGDFDENKWILHKSKSMDIDFLLARKSSGDDFNYSFDIY